jgi:hypothetical protein
MLNSFCCRELDHELVAFALCSALLVPSQGNNSSTPFHWAFLQFKTLCSLSVSVSLNRCPTLKTNSCHSEAPLPANQTISICQGHSVEIKYLNIWDIVVPFLVGPANVGSKFYDLSLEPLFESFRTPNIHNPKFSQAVLETLIGLLISWISFHVHNEHIKSAAKDKATQWCMSAQTHQSVKDALQKFPSVTEAFQPETDFADQSKFSAGQGCSNLFG